MDLKIRPKFSELLLGLCGLQAHSPAHITHFLVREQAPWTVHIPGCPAPRAPGKGTLLAGGLSASMPPSPRPGCTPTSHSVSLCTQETHAVLIQTEGSKKHGGNDRHGNVNLSKDLPTMKTMLNSQSSKWLSMGGKKLSFHSSSYSSCGATAEAPGPPPQQVLFHLVWDMWAASLRP